MAQMADVTTSLASRAYEFNGFRLEKSRRLLIDAAGRPVELPTKGYDTLVYFLDHPGTIISRATLLEAVWPRTIVDENNLSQAIAALRRVLGEQSILTVPRQGYQFVLDVRRAEVGTHGSEPNRVQPIRTLTFVVAGFAALAVTAVALLSGPFDLGNRPAPEASSSVTDAVASLVPEPLPTDSVAAMARFVEAETIAWSDAPNAPEAQLDKLDEAIAIDPDFALAYAHRASARMSWARQKLIRPGLQRIDEDIEQATRDIEQALELDPKLGLAYAWMGILKVQAGSDDGRLLLKRALDLSPNDRQVVGMAALYSVVAGHGDQALELFDRYSRQFDPIGFDWSFFYLAGDIEDAARRANRVVSENPTNVYHRFALGLLLALLDERAAAERELRMFEALAEDISIEGGILANLVYAYGRIGMDREAKRVFAELVRAVPEAEELDAAYWLNAYLGIGDIERALDWAERSAAEPFLLFPGPKLEFVLNSMQDPILERPEFSVLRQRPELIALQRRPGILD
jgi:DNA-binding winged helix-turn-helix (wHTH) protein/tetratricopeptide (TPR) repeat protein